MTLRPLPVNLVVTGIVSVFTQPRGALAASEN
jgi:hypothetical protein